MQELIRRTWNRLARRPAEQADSEHGSNHRLPLGKWVDDVVGVDGEVALYSWHQPTPPANRVTFFVTRKLMILVRATDERWKLPVGDLIVVATQVDSYGRVDRIATAPTPQSILFRLSDWPDQLELFGRPSLAARRTQTGSRHCRRDLRQRSVSQSARPMILAHQSMASAGDWFSKVNR